MCRGLKQIFSSMRYRRTVQLLGLTDPQNSTSMAKCFALLLEPCKPKVDWVLQVIPRNCHRHSDMQSNFRRYLNKSQRKWKKIYIYSRFYEVSFLEQINCKWTYWKVISFSFSHWELLSFFFFFSFFLSENRSPCLLIFRQRLDTLTVAHRSCSPQGSNEKSVSLHRVMESALRFLVAWLRYRFCL